VTASLILEAPAGEPVMQATVVMLIGLSGLGCQNLASDLLPIPAATAATADSSANLTATSPAPTAYPTYAVSPPISSDIADGESFRHCLRNTIHSFFIGRDPDVPTARQIEAAYYAGQHGR
jgi:hypothetical protein